MVGEKDRKRILQVQAMIAIIDYRAGNLTSVQRALNFLEEASIITDDPDIIKSADKIIFPGVGAAGKAMKDLKEIGNSSSIIEEFFKELPMLGICLGVQIIMDWSEENNTTCLGLIRGTVR